jgi:hypothetical protein
MIPVKSLPLLASGDFSNHNHIIKAAWDRALKDSQIFYVAPPDPSCSIVMYRERRDQEKKFKEQIDTLSSQISELDAENRKLRESKYELDSKVGENLM